MDTYIEADSGIIILAAAETIRACVTGVRRDLTAGLLDSATIATAVTMRPQGHYGMALQVAFKYARAASDYFTGKMDMDALRAKLDIGVPGSDGLTV